MGVRRYRPDKDGAGKSIFEKNKRRILANTDVCALCGAPLDKRLKFPHPLSATIDHIIPINKGGHPTAIENMQAAHLICNQMKGSKLTIEGNKDLIREAETISNRDLPKFYDWQSFGKMGG